MRLGEGNLQSDRSCTLSLEVSVVSVSLVVRCSFLPKRETRLCSRSSIRKVVLVLIGFVTPDGERCGITINPGREERIAIIISFWSYLRVARCDVNCDR